MKNFEEKYINPFTDFGFKKLFGEEPNKNLLLDFLNELLKEEQGEITELQYLKSEHLGATERDLKAIFDLYCINERGERFIVELQKTKQKFFKDKESFFYEIIFSQLSTFANRRGKFEELEKKVPQAYRVYGEDTFFSCDEEIARIFAKDEKVYTIVILDFEFDDDKSYPNKFRYDVKLKDIETNKVFSDKLNFIYLEMPKFNKSIDELETRFEKWLFVIKNLNRLEGIPEKLQEKVFLQLFETAEIAKFTKEEYKNYENSLKYYRDIKNSLDTAKEEGVKEGIEIGRDARTIEIAKSLLDVLDIETISAKTGLSLDEIRKL